MKGWKSLERSLRGGRKTLEVVRGGGRVTSKGAWDLEGREKKGWSKIPSRGW